jgi:2-haloacid dehalogenase
VPAALTALRAKGFRLAAISNTDDDLIAGSLPSLGLALDAVIAAQQAQAHKPDPRLCRHAHAALGGGPAETIHVAASQPLDMAMGIRAFRVNRRRSGGSAVAAVHRGEGRGRGGAADPRLIRRGSDREGIT